MRSPEKLPVRCWWERIDPGVFALQATFECIRRKTYRPRIDGLTVFLIHENDTRVYHNWPAPHWERTIRAHWLEVLRTQHHGRLPYVRDLRENE